jgi:hypothetical protein
VVCCSSNIACQNWSGGVRWVYEPMRQPPMLCFRCQNPAAVMACCCNGHDLSTGTVTPVYECPWCVSSAGAAGGWWWQGLLLLLPEGGMVGASAHLAKQAQLQGAHRGIVLVQHLQRNKAYTPREHTHHVCSSWLVQVCAYGVADVQAPAQLIWKAEAGAGVHQAGCGSDVLPHTSIGLLGGSHAANWNRARPVHQPCACTSGCGRSRTRV